MKAKNFRQFIARQERQKARRKKHPVLCEVLYQAVWWGSAIMVAAIVAGIILLVANRLT